RSFASAVLARETLVVLLLGCAGVLCLCWIWLNVGWIRDLTSLGLPYPYALKVYRTPLVRGTLNELAPVFLLLSALLLGKMRRETWDSVEGIFGSLALGSLYFGSVLLVFSRTGYFVLALLVVAAIVGLCKYQGLTVARGIICCVLLLGLFKVANDFTHGAVRTTAGVMVTEGQRRSAFARVAVWTAGSPSMARHWAWGSGPGSFSLSFLSLCRPTADRPFVSRPLNTLIGVWFETGIVGVCLQLGILFSAIGVLVALWKNLSSVQRYKAWVYTIGITVFWILESTESSLLENPTVCVLYFLSVAFLITQSGFSMKPSATCTLNAFLLASCCLPLLAMVVGSRRLLAEHYSQNAVTYIRQGNLDAAAIQLAKATRFHRGAYLQQAEIYVAAKKALPELQPLERPPHFNVDVRRQLQEVLQRYDTLARSFPPDNVVLQNRAWIEFVLQPESDESIHDLRDAIAIDGSDPISRILLGMVLETRQELSSADEQYALALESSPDLAYSPFARMLKLRSERRWKDIVQRALEGARVKATHGSPLAVARVGALYLLSDQIDSAVLTLTNVTREMPQLGHAWRNLGWAHLRRGDISEAELCLRRAIFIAPDDTLATALLSIAEYFGESESVAIN